MTPSITRHNNPLQHKEIVKKIGIKLAVALFWMAVWQAAYLYVAQEILLVSPVQAFARLFELGKEGHFWLSVGASCVRIVSGFLLAVMTGVILAIATACSNVLYQLFSPLLNLVRATPVASFIILALVWIRTAQVPMFISFLMVLPMIWANVFTGIQETDQELLEMARVFRMPLVKRIQYIYVPSVMPYFVAACTTGLGFSWKSGIAAEVIALPRYSIGKQIYNAKIYLETQDLFAWTIAVILLSVLIEKLAVWGLKKLQARLAKGA